MLCAKSDKFGRAIAFFAVALTLVTIPGTSQTGPVADQIAQLEQKLADARRSQRQTEIGSDLIALGYLYRQAGKVQKALACLNEALSIEKSGGSRVGEASAMNNLGRVYSDLGEEDKALGYLNQALTIYRSADARQGEASTLNNLGRTHNNLGQRDEALKELNESLSLWHEINAHGGEFDGGDRVRTRGALGHSSEASTLDSLGRTYTDMGRGEEALKYYELAVPIWREVGEKGGEALTRSNMGRTYADLGQKQKSLESYNLSLSLWRAIGNRQGEASTLNGVGRLYRDLGQQQMALDFYNQALPLWREVGNRNGEALALNDIGRSYADMGQGRKAIEYFDQSLPIWHETGNKHGEASTLNNTGLVLLSLGEAAKALEIDSQALAIWRETKDRRGEALALTSIGSAYYAQKDFDKSLAGKLAALALAKEASDPLLEGSIETSLMFGFRTQKHPEEAILFGMDAVNSYQKIRRNITGLDKDLQTGFTESKSSTYRVLAELLVQADRLGEAEEVLDLLKEEELKEVVRGAAANPESKTEGLQLTSAQQKAEVDLENQEKLTVSLMELTAKRAALQAKQNRTAEETAHMQELDSRIEAGNLEVTEFFRKTLYPQLAQKAGTETANTLTNREKSEVSRLQNTLAELGSQVLGIRLLMGQDHIYAIVVTAKARRRFELPASSSDVRAKVLEVREDLRRPSSDPKPHLAELYNMVVAPLDQELNALEKSASRNEVPTLLWSLDGVLRYVPMATLYDGHRYLAERFNNVLFTPESYGHMAATTGSANAALRVLAMGLSKSYGGLPALPGVLPELDAVAHDPSVPESHGPMDGQLLPDDQFTYAAMKTRLSGPSSFSVIHIASHFVLETRGGDEPYLMLGGETAGQAEGFPLTLSRIEDSTISFQGTRLLTLSACSTAKGDVADDGLEVDSLGMVAQRKDAEAVLATLWDVNDVSTSRLMSDFYARWVSHPEQGKAEALRQAQLAFLRGTTPATATIGHRGLQAERDAAPSTSGANYSHPFYWAPFVLTGNYR
jgi:CHAT domain-containing protein/Tfp pilus assembly protein PilF